ncbi:Putative 8-oxo-dGTP diphosphatase YtkD [Listeria grayi]|uniref:8-oxo-dGTP diphosphatase YtkD n=1 Tax=Listeria grayi TaxID=1641 RepID=A0A378MB40_LISGR|nr:Putative 8-oxo-dGTP diphosphatase YtkD [Listeria grayi]
MYRYQDEFRNQVTISLKAQTKEADDCLVIPVYQGKFLFTMHKTRGIEFPGGKASTVKQRSWLLIGSY